MKRSGHFSVAVKQESLFSINWDLTTFNLLKTQFHSSKKISYSGYCRVHSDGRSLIALGRKIPDVSYIVAKLTTFCLGRSLQIRWSSAAKEMNTAEWHMHDLQTATYRDLILIWAHIWMEQGIVLLKLFCIFLVSERILYRLIFSAQNVV